ncbi:hypothetical protein C9374_007161 [Naegleria lovaniensis]|uniref:Uncharacterized protein n=1 Tax=Naegleria lovaniensis TaxID=51637 RepID=A0AA88H2T4_NAELO|nr:uncharacterized protein C9374_007161 [Naegleria lovaniensis]KAG2393630.1 hypothetical protein C9374_007161 [Naegleria lovaniensis]
MSNNNEEASVSDVSKVESMTSEERAALRKKKFTNQKSDDSSNATASSSSSASDPLTDKDQIQKRKERFAADELQKQINSGLGMEPPEKKKKGTKRGIKKQSKTGGNTRGGYRPRRGGRGRGGKRN